MESWHIPVLMLVGVATGWLNVVAGGGSLISVPVMLFLGLPGPVANGTNRIAILMQNITAVTTFRRQGLSDFRLSLSLAAAAIAGAVGGAYLGTAVAGVWFNRILAAIMAGVLALMLSERAQKATVAGAADGRPRRLLLGHILMIGAGAWGGFIQIGVGFIMMPILARVMGLDLVRVNMHKVFIILVYTPVTLLIFASRVEIAWGAGIALGLGTAVGGWLGTHATISKGAPFIRRIFAATVVALIIKLVFFP